jgi:predicted ArsR family transcriptional regulator
MGEMVALFISDKLENSEMSFEEKCVFVREVLTDVDIEMEQKALAYKTLVLSQKVGDKVPADIIKLGSKLMTKEQEEFHSKLNKDGDYGKPKQSKKGVEEKKVRPISKQAILSIWLVRNKEMEADLLASKTGVKESQAKDTFEELVATGDVKKRIINAQSAQGIRTATLYSLTTEEEKRIMLEKEINEDDVLEPEQDEDVLDDAEITDKEVVDLVVKIAKEGKKKATAKPKVEVAQSDDDLIDALVKKAETEEMAGMEEAKELAKQIEGTPGEKDSAASKKKASKGVVKIDAEKKKITIEKPIKVAKVVKEKSEVIRVSTKITLTTEDKEAFKKMASDVSGQTLEFSETSTRVAAKLKDNADGKLGSPNLFTLLYDRPIPIIVMNRIKADKLPGSVPVKSWLNYASTPFNDPNREKLMKTYVALLAKEDVAE